MDTVSRLMDLLRRWEVERQQGRLLTPEELCRDDPELLDSIRQQLAQRSSRDEAHATQETTAPAGADGTVLAVTRSSSRFQPLRLHARGGLGEVYLAHDGELNREVALKQMQGHLADKPDLHRRFLMEAEVTGRLEHPGVVPVYGLGVDGQGRPYYAMRFIRGQTLQEALAAFHRGDEDPRRDPGERSLALRGLLRRFVDVCNAVAYAHSRGILHRDLKPANVLLGDYGETLVVDWGLARPVQRREADRERGEETLRPESRPETTQGTVGTPAYMAPEQAAGRQSLLGPTSDVYSLGATLYHLLTGQAPFERAALDVLLERVQRGEFPPPRQVNRQVPAALEAVCLKAMALKREDRYPGPAELAADVEAWLADEPVQARPEPLGERARRWLKRRRTAVLATLAGGAVALVALAVSTVLLRQANEAERAARGLAEDNEQLAQEQRRTALDARDRAREAEAREKKARLAAQQSERRVRDNLYASNIGLAWQAWQDGQVVRARGFLRELLPRPGEEDLRGFEWRYLWRQSHQAGLRRLRGHTGRISALAFAADGMTLASASQDGTILLWQTGTGRPVGVLAPDPEGEDGQLGVTWGKRGDRVVIEQIGVSGPAGLDGRLAAGDELVAISADRGERVPVAGRSLEEVRRLERGPAGTPVVLQVRTPVGLRRCTLIRRRPAASLGSRFSGQVLVAFDPTGKVLVSATGTAVRLWDPQRRLARHNLVRHDSDVTALAFRPDGQVLATGDTNGQVHLWDVRTGKHAGSLRSRQEGSKWLHALTFTPDGKALLASSGDYLVLFDLASRSRREALFNADKPIVSLAYLGDGQTLALSRAGARDNVELWDARTLKRQTFLHGHTDWVRALALTADGWTLASAGADHTVRLWDPGTGRLRATLRGHGSAVETVACAPEGDLLASGDHGGVILLWDSAREMRGHTLEVHSRSGVNDLLVGTDNRTLLGAAGGGRGDANAAIEVWDLRNRQSRGLVHRPPAWVRDLDFSPDGKSLAVSFSPGTDTAVPGECKVYDLATGRVRLHLAAFSATAGVGFSEDGKTLITASGSFLHEAPGEVRLHDASTGQVLRTFRPHRGRCAARLVENGKTLLTHGIRLRPGSGRATLAWWDLQTGRRKRRLEGDFAQLLSADLSPDGKVLAVVLGDYFHQEVPAEVKLLDAASGKELARLTGHKGLVGYVGFAPDGKTVGVPGWDGGIRFYEVPGGKELFSLPHQPGQVHGLAFSADGKRVTAGILPKKDATNQTGFARVWDLTTRKQIASFEMPAGSTPLTVLSRDGRLLAAGNTRGGVRLWDLPTGKERLLQPGEEHTPAAFRSRSVACTALSPDGKTLASGGWDSRVTLWDLDPTVKDGRPGRFRRTILTGEVVSALAFTRDGKTLAVGTGGRAPIVWPGRLCLIDLVQGKVRTTLRVGAARISALALLPDGRTLVAATDHHRTSSNPSELFLLDTVTGKRGPTIHRGAFYTRSLAVSPDGRRLAFDEGRGTIHLLDRTTGKVERMPGHVNVLYRLAFAPDGRTLVSASADGTVKLWHLSTRREMLGLLHEHWVEGLAFSPDGTTLVSGSQANLRGTVHLWEAGPVAVQQETWYDPAEAGYSRAVRTEDEWGRVVEVKYLSAEGLPAAGPLGEARKVIRYGLDGKESGRSYFDTRGRPMKLDTPPERPRK